MENETKNKLSNKISPKSTAAGKSPKPRSIAAGKGPNPRSIAAGRRPTN